MRLLQNLGFIPSQDKGFRLFFGEAYGSCFELGNLRLHSALFKISVMANLSRLFSITKLIQIEP
jgi:hypothetical protein